MPSTLSSKMLLLKALLSMGSTDLGRVNVESREGKEAVMLDHFLGGWRRHSHHLEKAG